MHRTLKQETLRPCSNPGPAVALSSFTTLRRTRDRDPTGCQVKDRAGVEHVPHRPPSSFRRLRPRNRPRETSSGNPHHASSAWSAHVSAASSAADASSRIARSAAAW